LLTVARDTFFEPQFLNRQLKSKLGTLSEPETITANLTALMDSPTFEQMLTDKLESMNSSPLGMMLSMMNLTADKLKPFLKVRVSVRDPGPGAGQRGHRPDHINQGDEGQPLPYADLATRTRTPLTRVR
jgi:hypothetical protein